MLKMPFVLLNKVQTIWLLRHSDSREWVTYGWGIGILLTSSTAESD